MKTFACGLLALTTALAPGAASARTGAATCFYFAGSVGDHPIGADLAISETDHLTITAANYFYANKRIDIPLDARTANGMVTLREPGGGVFALRFEPHAPGDKPPFTFYNTTALSGTWTSNGHALPARLTLSGSGACPGEAKYTSLGVSDDRAFESMVGRFVHGVTTHDITETARTTHFPLRVNRAGKSHEIRDRAELEKRWSQIFTADYVAKLRGAVPHNLFVRNGMAMIGDGEAWFDDKGAIAINSVTPHAAVSRRGS